MLGLHYTTWGSVNVEALYSGFSQKMTSGIDSVSWTNKTSLAYLEFPVLLHFITPKFKYIEVGVKFSNLKSAKGTLDSPLSALSYTNKDIQTNFEKPNTALVFGWGSAFLGNGGGLLSFGIRLSYGFSDIISIVGGKGEAYFPMQDGAANSKGYTKTNTATIGFHFSYDFDLGWVTKSSCSRKYKFTLFKH